MIGTALGKADMRKLVDHMADIDKPWVCLCIKNDFRKYMKIYSSHTFLLNYVEVIIRSVIAHLTSRGRS